MELIGDLRKKRTLLGFVCTLTFKVFLSLVDVVSVIVCFMTAFCLIYLTILKDSAEVLVYVAAKYTSRIKWLCRVLRVDSLFEIGTADLLQSAISEDPLCDYGCNVSVSEPDNQQILSVISESACGSDRRDEKSVHSQNRPCDHAEGSTEATAGAYSSSSPPTPQNNLSNFDDTHFDEVDLASDKNNDVSSVSVESSHEKSTPKGNASFWSVQAGTLLSSLQRRRLPSADSVKASCKSIASKVADVFSNQVEDKEKLLPFNGSPEQMGCCPSIPRFFKERLQMSPTGSPFVPYEQF